MRTYWAARDGDGAVMGNEARFIAGHQFRFRLFVKAELKNCATYLVGNMGRFARHGHKKLNKLSLLEPVTGNLSSLMCRENSLLLLRFDGLSARLNIVNCAACLAAHA